VRQSISIETVDTGTTVVVVRISGALDSTNANDTAEALLSHVPHAASARLVADLSGITYVDSAGVRAFVELSDRLRRNRQALALVAPAESRISRVLSIVKMELLVPVHQTVEAAVDAAASPAAEDGS
jgi:stage II sporulation protein AA (anti-sigma F factor antagonist)